MNILENLNEEQKNPVITTEGAVLVTAGAGSGKTRLLTHRIAYLIYNKGVKPYNILAITFTNKAAKEMEKRVNSMIDGAENIWISTFHALCVRILRSNIDKIGYTKDFSIYSDVEKSRILKDIFKELHIEDDATKKQIDFHIANAKNHNLSPEEYQNELFTSSKQEIIKAYEMYQNQLKKNNALDFDDLLNKTLFLLETNKEVLDYYSNKFQYIHIDEFQDTNEVQYKIAKLLASKWGNIMIVGDEDQCIYGWRGANIDNINNFIKDFPNVNIFKLEQNYRSTKKILSVANKVIKFNEQRIDKTLWTDNDEGADVQFVCAPTDHKEAEFVVKTIADYVHNKGYNYSDFAILLRLNAPSRLFESYLNNAGIPYKMLGGFKFFERTEIKGIIAYLRAVVNPFDNESVARILNFPKRGIGDTTLEKIKILSRQGSLLDVILNLDNYPEISGATKTKLENFATIYKDLQEKKNSPLNEFVEFLIERAGFSTAFESGNEEDIARKLNIGEYIDSVAEFVKANPNFTISDYLQSITLTSDIDNLTDENNVLISTVHAVKGLEFKVVFVSALEEGLFPILRNGNESQSDIEEERRLMYVAATRAEQELFLTCATRRFLYNDEKYNAPSRFLKEMGFVPEKQFVMNHLSLNNNYNGNNINNTFNKPKSDLSSFMQSKINQQQKDVSMFVAGTKVFHPSFGIGVITDDSKLDAQHLVTVSFEIVGSKTLSLDYAPLKIFK